MLKLNTSLATAADNVNSGIKETGKYVGTITRAEALTSVKGTKGLGLSFKADTGATAEYLDIYHTKGDGEALSGLRTVNAILACAKVREADEGPIRIEKYDPQTRQRNATTVQGYPSLMGKRIGLLLQKTLETNSKTGTDQERVQIFGVFDADTELTASEILSRVTTPSRLGAMTEALMARPVRDNRKTNVPSRAPARMDDGYGPDDLEIPF